MSTAGTDDRTPAPPRADAADVPTRLRLEHRSRYRFDPPARLGPHQLRLHPRAHSGVHVVAHELTTAPATTRRRVRRDRFGNRVTELRLPGTIDHLEIVSRLTIERRDRPPPGTRRPASTQQPAGAAAGAPRSPAHPLGDDRPGEMSHTVADAERLADASALTTWLHRELRYEERDEDGVTDAGTTLRARRGSCRDSAWVAVTWLRRRAVPARFVCGYLLTPAGEGWGAALHAWFEVALGSGGWVGFDPTAGAATGGRHVPLAVGDRPQDTAVVSGTTTPTAARLTTTIAVS